ncbi:hypothetical protein T484DRAFT_1810949 [Baffinella frigidus]|nr:hypothetical protein T484DRAFT_1810949 [Cryptophyta sp. CCMP2293]
MLPVCLATKALSLFEGIPRDAMTFSALIDADGAVSDYRIFASTLENPRQITYQKVDDFLDAIQGYLAHKKPPAP